MLDHAARKARRLMMSPRITLVQRGGTLPNIWSTREALLGSLS